MILQAFEKMIENKMTWTHEFTKLRQYQADCMAPHLTATRRFYRISSNSKEPSARHLKDEKKALSAVPQKDEWNLCIISGTQTKRLDQKCILSLTCEDKLSSNIQGLFTAVHNT